MFDDTVARESGRQHDEHEQHNSSHGLGHSAER